MFFQEKNCNFAAENDVIIDGIVQNLTHSVKYKHFLGMIIGRKKKGAVFQLTDFYTLFYFKYIQYNVRGDRQYWSKSINTPMHSTWCGLAFERVCLLHVDQIKRALSIGGVQSCEAAWYSTRRKKDEYRTDDAQIDLLIDRNDDVIAPNPLVPGPAGFSEADMKGRLWIKFKGISTRNRKMHNKKAGRKPCF